MIYFISGPINIISHQFNKNYTTILNRILLNDPNCKFIISDDNGTSKMAQEYLYNHFTNKHIPPYKFKQKINIYHCNKAPQYNLGFKSIGGFKSRNTRDQMMTHYSNSDIIWIPTNMLDLNNKNELINNINQRVVKNKK